MPLAGFSPVIVPPVTDGFAARGKFIVNKKADYTVTAADSGTIFHNAGGTANINFTLPAISTGPWEFWFVAGADYNLVVTAGTADTAITFNDVAADSVSFATSSEKIGGWVWAFSDGTYLFLLPNGSKESQHVTVTT